MITYPLKKPLFLSLYKAIRTDIEAGRLPAGCRLPSKRRYAMDLHLSLSTVKQALDLLEQEGYIEGRQRRGMFVQSGMQRLRRPDLDDFHPLEEDPPRPDADFPASLWFKTMRLIMSRDAPWLSQKSPAAGSARLRNVLAAYLRSSRSMHVQPEQIVIASGAQELYTIICRMFGADFQVAIEADGYPVIRHVYRSHGAALQTLARDENGLLPASLQDCGCPFLHISPFWTLPADPADGARRRRACLDWLRAEGRWLIEDDFNSEFVTGGPVLQTLFEMDSTGRVLYLNTFSKTLSASLRLGYMVLPEELIEKYQKTAQDLACTVTMLEQYTLAEFIENGSFERLIARRRRHQIAAGNSV